MSEKKIDKYLSLIYWLSLSIGISEIIISFLYIFLYNMQSYWMCIIPGGILILLFFYTNSENQPISDILELSTFLILSILLMVFINQIEILFYNICYTFNVFDYLKLLGPYPFSDMIIIDLPYYWGYIGFIVGAWSIGVLREIYIDKKGAIFTAAIFILSIIATIYIMLVQKYVNLVTNVNIYSLLYVLIIFWAFATGYIVWILLVHLGSVILSKPEKPRRGFKIYPK